MIEKMTIEEKMLDRFKKLVLLNKQIEQAEKAKRLRDELRVEIAEMMDDYKFAVLNITKENLK